MTQPEDEFTPDIRLEDEDNLTAADDPEAWLDDGTGGPLDPGEDDDVMVEEDE